MSRSLNSKWCPPPSLIRLGVSNDLPHIAAAEIAASSRFQDVPEYTGLTAEQLQVPLSPDSLNRSLAQECLWVATHQNEIVGFLAAELFGKELYIQEVDVLLSHGRHGLGRALMLRAMEQAERSRLERVVLRTFERVPWNAPFYRRMGFTSLSDADLTPVMQAVLEKESDKDLRSDLRIFLQYPISAGGVAIRTLHRTGTGPKGSAKLYDTIGINYSALRKPDPRIAALMESALGPAETVLNVGAGAGSYEPSGKQVTAVEPSAEMIRQRPPSAAVVIQGCAEELPFDDNSFDASMAVLTVHHWSDQAKGLKEMRRVTRGKVVLLTYDPSFRDFWLTDYIPELVTLDQHQMSKMTDYERWLGSVHICPVPIPHDCTDGFLSAYWRRPAAYLDPKVRAAISCFWAIGDVSQAWIQLEEDLGSGAWATKYSHLLNLDTYDCGNRLVVAG